jgi:hypothetical protein
MSMFFFVTAPVGGGSNLTLTPAAAQLTVTMATPVVAVSYPYFNLDITDDDWDGVSSQNLVGTGFSTTNLVNYAGNRLDISGAVMSFYRFEHASMADLAGASIISATFSPVSAPSDGDPLTNIYAEAAASPTAPTNHTDAQSRVTTTAFTAVDSNGPPDGTRYDIDVTAVIQEIADNFTPTAIQILWKDDGSNPAGFNYVSAYDYSNSPADAAQLEVHFVPANASAPVINYVEPSTFGDNRVGVQVQGTNFGATQGAGTVKLSPTNDIFDPDVIEQTVTAWGEATNLVTNGGFETDTTGYFTAGTNALVSTNLVGANKYGARVLQFTAGDNALIFRYPITLTAAQHQYSAWVYVPSNWDGAALQVRVDGFTSGINNATNNPVNMALRDQWQRVVCNFTPVVGDLAGELRIIRTGTAPTVGRTFWADGVQCEVGSLATPYIETNGSTATGQYVQFTSETTDMAPGTRYLFVTNNDTFSNFPGAPVTVLPSSHVLTPSAAQITITAGTPILHQPQRVTPPAASLTVTAGTPTVAATENVYLTPGNAWVNITPGTPNVFVSQDQDLIPDPAQITVTGGTPVVRQGTILHPAAAQLTITAGIPRIGQDNFARPAAVQITISTGAPTILNNVLVRPAAAALTVTPGTPTVSFTTILFIRPAAAGLVVTGGVPRVRQTQRGAIRGHGSGRIKTVVRGVRPPVRRVR